jgi:hypothetical protein
MFGGTKGKDKEALVAKTRLAREARQAAVVATELDAKKDGAARAIQVWFFLPSFLLLVSVSVDRHSFFGGRYFIPTHHVSVRGVAWWLAWWAAGCTTSLAMR